MRKEFGKEFDKRCQDRKFENLAKQGRYKLTNGAINPVVKIGNSGVRSRLILPTATNAVTNYSSNVPVVAPIGYSAMKAMNVRKTLTLTRRAYSQF
jgi:hypothetical protein